MRALVADAVDVGRLADHQAAMIDARLHPADVVAHDEQDVGLLLRQCRLRREQREQRAQRSKRRKSFANSCVTPNDCNEIEVKLPGASGDRRIQPDSSTR